MQKVYMNLKKKHDTLHQIREYFDLFFRFFFVNLKNIQKIVTINNIKLLPI